MKRLRNISALHFFQCCLCFFFLFGVGSQSTFATSALDPDRNSHSNRRPEGATSLRLDYCDAEDNTISFDAGDQTDWYVVKVRQDGELEVILKNKIEGDLELEAYGPDMTTLLGNSNTPGTAIEMVTFPVEARRRYYLKVYAKGPGHAGDYSIQNVFHKKDTEAPYIVVPRQEWTIMESSLILSGTLKDNRKITALLLNETNIFSATDVLNQEAGEIRAFSYTITDLALGETTLTLQAKDQAGNVSAPLTIRILRQDPPPDIQVNNLPGATPRIKEPQVIIRGVVLDNEDITRLLINGEELTDIQTEHSQSDVRFLANNQIEFAYTLKDLDYGVHSIKIFAEDNNAQISEKTLTIRYDSPPQISIVNPQEGKTTQSEIEIQGVVTDDVALSQLLINDENLFEHKTSERLQQVETAPGKPIKWKFTYQVSELKYGPNTIAIVAKDDFDNVTKYAVIVERTEVPPNVVIALPADGEECTEETVLVKGYVKDSDGVKEVTINGTPVPIDPSGAFEYSLPSPPQGPYTIMVKAIDARDNEGRASVNITKIDHTLPRIQMISPDDGAYITGPRKQITCIVSDNAQIEQITIHGEEKGGTETDGEEKKFDHLITNLKEGANPIEITAIDVNGNQSREVITINSLNPDYRSGDDREPAGAGKLKLNSRYTNTLSYKKGDRTDWYKLQIPTYGELHIFVHNKLAGDLEVQLYSAEPDEDLPAKWIALAEAATRGSGNEYLHQKIEGGRWVFVKVFAHQWGDEGDYTIENSFYEIDNKPPRIILNTKELSTFETSITINGTVKDEKGIADISVNGKQLIPLPERLPGTSEDIRIFSATVALHVGKNRIDIRTKDGSGNQTEDHIIVDRQNPVPKITLENPDHDGIRFAGSSLIVKGIVQDDDEVKRVMLNDIDISGSLKIPSESLIKNREKQVKEFEYQLEFDTYGEHQIHVTAFDNVDAQSQQMLTVYRDKPPKITIETPPKDVFQTRAESITLRGKVDNDWKGVRMKVNGLTLATVAPLLGDNGGQGVQQNFTQQVALKYGSNPIQIEAEDDLENITSKTLTIVREEVEPEITISVPCNQKSRIIEDNVLIEGRVNDLDGIAVVTIDGETVPLNTSNEFHHQMTQLPYGTREIVIVAKDTRGNATTQKLHIDRIDQETPSIDVMNLEDGEKTRENEIRINIKVQDNDRLKCIHGNDRKLYGEIEELGAEKSFIYLAQNLTEGVNQITIIAEDMSKNKTSHLIRIHKVPPPAILIKGANQGKLETVEKALTINGTIQTVDDIASLNINGNNVSVDRQAGNSFIYTSEDLQVGENSLKLIAIDTLGGTTREELVITRIDKTPPRLEIKSPKNGERTREDDILVEIQVYDDDRIEEIIINGETLQGSDTPEAIVNRTHNVAGLKYGNNSIRVIARDASGNHASQTHEVYKIHPPQIVVSKPKPPARTVPDAIEVQGYVQTDDTIQSVLIEGDVVEFNPADTNRFSHQVHLPEIGNNIIELIAVDSLGGASRHTVTIERVGPDYQSGRDKARDGANILPQEGTVDNNLTVDYNQGDRTDWFYITFETTGDWIIRVTNAEHGFLDVEIYDSDGITRLKNTPISGMGSDELQVNIRQAGKYYAKIMAHGEGDRGHYTIQNNFYEVDRIPPEIIMNSPQGEEVWINEEDTLTISGTAEDNSEIKGLRFQPEQIKAIGSYEIVGKILTFDYRITGLRPSEENILDIIAVDGVGNEETHHLRILVSKEKPENSRIQLLNVYPAKILATDKEDNIRKVETQSDAITLEGRVIAGNGDRPEIRARVLQSRTRNLTLHRSIPAVATKEQFVIEDVPLHPGKNEVTLEIIEVSEQEHRKTEFILLAERTENDNSSHRIEQEPDLLQTYLGLREGNVYAVIIGISDYRDDNIRDLQFAVNDAQGVFDVLVDPDYGRVPRENIKLLVNEKATVTNIKSAIGTWLSENAQEEDTVLIYYAGHGAEEKGDTYWVTYDASHTDLFSSALSNNDISGMFDRIRSKRLITLLDSCYSAATVKSNTRGGTRNTLSLTQDPFKQFTGEGRITISASDGTQLSLELEEYGHGVFTYYLLEGLKGKADQDGDHVVDVDEIWLYVKDQVTVKARESNNPQKPTIQGQHTSGILLTFDLPSFQIDFKDKQKQTRKQKITELYNDNKLSAEEFGKLLYLLNTDEEERSLHDFFNGALSLEHFKEAIKYMIDPLESPNVSN